MSATIRATRRSGWLALVLGAGIAIAGLAAHAQSPERPSGWGYHLANELMSPYCPGRTLNDCPSSQASELKRWILAQEAAGRREADVETELYARYGDVILQAPRASGFGLAAYVLPVLAVLAGATLIATFLRRQRPSNTSEPFDSSDCASSPAGGSPALEAELEAELAARR